MMYSLRQKWYPIVVAAIFLFYIARLVFFAATIGADVAPDEFHHRGVIDVYAQSWGLPENSSATAPFGVIRGLPYLYYFIMGKLSHIHIPAISDVLFLRLFSVCFSVVTLGLFFLCLRLLSPCRGAHVAGLLLLSNTAMYTFMGAMVSYDVLVNLCAVGAFYFFIRLFQRPTGVDVYAFLLTLALGCLVKTAYLPLAVLFFLCAIIVLRQHFVVLLLSVEKNVKTMLLVGACCVSVCACIVLYVGNVIQYGHYVPKMLQVYSEDEAREYRIIAQEHTIEQFRKGTLSFYEARERVAKIAHEPDRKAAEFMLHNARVMREHGVPLIDRLSYIPLWSWLMVESTVSVMGHKYMVKPYSITAAYCGIMSLLFFVWVFALKRCDKVTLHMCAAVIILMYAAILLFYVNYPLYERCGFIAYGIQGRYVFPVLPMMYALGVQVLARTSRKSVQYVVWGMVVMFLYGDFPYFLMHVTPEWYVQ